jgi:hypothetical protein
MKQLIVAYSLCGSLSPSFNKVMDYLCKNFSKINQKELVSGLAQMPKELVIDIFKRGDFRVYSEQQIYDVALLIYQENNDVIDIFDYIRYDHISDKFLCSIPTSKLKMILKQNKPKVFLDNTDDRYSMPFNDKLVGKDYHEICSNELEYKYLPQKLYTCETFKFNRSQCICYSCKEKCHKDHKVKEIANCYYGLCNCGKCCECKLV